MHVLRTTPEEVKQRIDAGKVIVFVDSRREGAWSESDVKLPGAIRVPPEDPERYLDRVPPDREIVAYCT